MQSLVRDTGFNRVSTKVALIAVFTGLSLGTNYVLIDLPNVKVMDALVFVSAFLFGLEVGLGVAVCSRLVYAVNPWGTATLDLLLFLMLGETFYALAGFILSRTSLARDLIDGRELRRESIILVILSFIWEFASDSLQNCLFDVLLTNSF